MARQGDGRTAGNAIDAAIAAWVRNSRPADFILSVDRSDLLRQIDLNGMGPFLARATSPGDLPDDLARSLRERLLAREMWEEQHKRVLGRTLVALTDAGLNPLLLKGTALAYSHYPNPATRVRGDTDILVEENGREKAFTALENAGFVRPLSAGGSTLTAEALFQAKDLRGQKHDIDMHWRLNSSPVLARLFSHAELLARSVAIADLHPQARRLGDVDALLYGAVHRRLHVDRPTYIYLNGVAYDVIDSLSWLKDIQLLAESLDRAARIELLERARSKGLADILRDALCQAEARLDAAVPSDLRDGLADAPPGPVAAYINARPLRALSMNLAATPGIRSKTAYLCELFFPPADYMRATFSKGRFDWLPVLHLRRIVPGMLKNLKKERTVT